MRRGALIALRAWRLRPFTACVGRRLDRRCLCWLLGALTATPRPLLGLTLLAAILQNRSIGRLLLAALAPVTRALRLALLATALILLQRRRIRGLLPALATFARTPRRLPFFSRTLAKGRQFTCRLVGLRLATRTSRLFRGLLLLELTTRTRRLLGRLFRLLLAARPSRLLRGLLLLELTARAGCFRRLFRLLLATRAQNFFSRLLLLKLTARALDLLGRLFLLKLAARTRSFLRRLLLLKLAARTLDLLGRLLLLKLTTRTRSFSCRLFLLLLAPRTSFTAATTTKAACGTSLRRFLGLAARLCHLNLRHTLWRADSREWSGRQRCRGKKQRKRRPGDWRRDEGVHSVYSVDSVRSPAQHIGRASVPALLMVRQYAQATPGPYRSRGGRNAVSDDQKRPIVGQPGARPKVTRTRAP